MANRMFLGVLLYFVTTGFSLHFAASGEGWWIFVFLLSSILFILSTVELVYKINKEEKENKKHIESLERFIRSGLFRHMDEQTLNKLSIGIVDKFMSGEGHIFPENFLVFICDYQVTYKVFRNAVLEKLDYLNSVLREELSKKDERSNLEVSSIISKRRNVEDLLQRLDKKNESQRGDIIYRSKSGLSEPLVFGECK